MLYNNSNFKVNVFTPSACKHLSGRSDDHCLRFSRTIADEWTGVYRLIIYSIVSYRVERKDRSSKAIDRFCMGAPQVPSHALTNRDVKQMFHADLSLVPLLLSFSLSLFLCERVWQILLPINHADRSPFGTRSLNVIPRSYPRKRDGDSKIQLYSIYSFFLSQVLYLHEMHAKEKWNRRDKTRQVQIDRC